MDQDHIQSPRSNPIDLYQDTIHVSNQNQNQIPTNKRQWRFTEIFQLSNAKEKPQSEEKQFKLKKTTQFNDFSGKLSPPMKRLPRRPILKVDDYQKYFEQLETKQQNFPPKIQKVQIKNNEPFLRKNKQSSKPLKKEKQHINLQDKNSLQQSQTILSTFNDSNFQKGLNSQRKRAPQSGQEKPIFKKMGTFGIQRRRNQESPKVEYKKIQYFQAPVNGLSSNFDNKKEINKRQIICFYCGGPHYANQCTQQNSNSLSYNQLRCFNCKKQGHTAKFCNQQRRCLNCQSIEHLAKNCPLNQQTKNEQKNCLNCLEPGHYAKQCKKPSKCFQCQAYGHQKKDCPWIQKNFEVKNQQYETKPKTCFNCKRTGHYAKQCKQPIICHKCGFTGHYARNCTHISQSYTIQNNGNVRNSNHHLNQKNSKKANSQFLKNIFGKKINPKQ